MTAFVLAAGGHTGGWVWREVAGRLRESGAEVHPATLTGMGDRRHLAGPDTGLETHVEDLVQLIDHTDAAEMVLVGHCYGIYPVTGAADRRPERVTRIVSVDAPLPQDGYAMLDQVREQMADETTRERVLGQAARAEGSRLVPPPTSQEWRTWGNVVGVPEDDVSRLARLSAPQPLGSFTQPLRLSGAVGDVPMSAVLCTVGGMTIAMAEELVTSAWEPRFGVFTDPRAGFFELATGHWPMLSTPGELTDVLLRAAAGEGHRLTTA